MTSLESKEVTASLLAKIQSAFNARKTSTREKNTRKKTEVNLNTPFLGKRQLNRQLSPKPPKKKVKTEVNPFLPLSSPNRPKMGSFKMGSFPQPSKRQKADKTLRKLVQKQKDIKKSEDDLRQLEAKLRQQRTQLEEEAAQAKNMRSKVEANFQKLTAMLSNVEAKSQNLTTKRIKLKKNKKAAAKQLKAKYKASVEEIAAKHKAAAEEIEAKQKAADEKIEAKYRNEAEELKAERKKLLQENKTAAAKKLKADQQRLQERFDLELLQKNQAYLKQRQELNSQAVAYKNKIDQDFAAAATAQAAAAAAAAASVAEKIARLEESKVQINAERNQVTKQRQELEALGKKVAKEIHAAWNQVAQERQELRQQLKALQEKQNALQKEIDAKAKEVNAVTKLQSIQRGRLTRKAIAKTRTKGQNRKTGVQFVRAADGTPVYFPSPNFGSRESLKRLASSLRDQESSAKKKKSGSVKSQLSDARKPERNAVKRLKPKRTIVKKKQVRFDLPPGKQQRRETAVVDKPGEPRKKKQVIFDFDLPPGKVDDNHNSIETGMSKQQFRNELRSSPSGDRPGRKRVVHRRNREVQSGSSESS